MTSDRTAGQMTGARRRPRGAVRDGLVAAGLELARAGGPDAVVLREAARMVRDTPDTTRHRIEEATRAFIDAALA